MKRRNVVMGVILASVLIVAIIIQATFGAGVGGGIRVEPNEMLLTQNTTRTFTIILQSVQSDSFYVSIIPGTCDLSWFKGLPKRVRVEPRVQTQLYLDVTPTESGEYYHFKVRAESNRGDLFVSEDILIFSEPPPTPTPGPTPGPTNKKPKCIGLVPDLSSPQTIMNVNDSIQINWTAYACDPDNDTIWYRFLQVGPAGEELTDWSTSNKFPWFANINDAEYGGKNYIHVYIKDKLHSTDFDDTRKCTYQIDESKPPYCLSLMPAENQFPPQPSGTQIIWTACVGDDDSAKDTFWYKFEWKRDTAMNWNSMLPWTHVPEATYTCTWFSYGVSPGDYEIRVSACDNYNGRPALPIWEKIFKKYTIT